MKDPAKNTLMRYSYAYDANGCQIKKTEGTTVTCVKGKMEMR